MDANTIEWDKSRLLRLVQACDTARQRLRQQPAERERDRLLERLEAMRGAAFEELAPHISRKRRAVERARVIAKNR